MTPEQFKAWRDAHFKSRRAAANALGISPSSIYFYEKGERNGKLVEIPKPIRLAMAAIALGLTDYHGPE